MRTFTLNLIVSVIIIAFNCCGTNNKENNGTDKDVTTQTVVEKHGKLSVDGIFMVDESGEKVALHGVSFGWHNWWPRFYNKGAVKTFANDWQCDVVRAAMGVEPERGYINEPEFSTQCVTRVVDAAIENGIYAIIDWHSHSIRTDEAVEFFRDMANRYKDYPNVIYEIFNEPVEDSWAEVKAYSEEVIKAIREIDKSNIIIVGSPHWDQDIHIVADDPITGYDNIMYSLHFYAATHHQFLRDRGDYAISKGIPIFVSECAGMEATGDGPIDYEEWQLWLDWMDNNHIGWAVWSIADKDETCSMMLPTAPADGNWNDNHLKEWGKIVREELTKQQ
ncbi:MAG: glycoside hydrolase family 5 protein [Fermentimonas sp.]|jgi:endoglucanase